MNLFFHQRGIKDVFFILALNVSIRVQFALDSQHNTQSAMSTAHNVCSSSNTDELMRKREKKNTTAAAQWRARRALDYCSIQTTTRLGGIRQQTTSAQAAEQQQRTFGIIDASRMTRWWCLSHSNKRRKVNLVNNSTDDENWRIK